MSKTEHVIHAASPKGSEEFFGISVHSTVVQNLLLEDIELRLGRKKPINEEIGYSEAKLSPP